MAGLLAGEVRRYGRSALLSRARIIYIKSLIEDLLLTSFVREFNQQRALDIWC